MLCKKMVQLARIYQFKVLCNHWQQNVKCLLIGTLAMVLLSSDSNASLLKWIHGVSACACFVDVRRFAPTG